MRYIKVYASCFLLWLFLEQFFYKLWGKEKGCPRNMKTRFFCGVSTLMKYLEGNIHTGQLARDVRVRDLQLSANIYLLLLVIIKCIVADLLQTLCQCYRVSGTGIFCHWSKVTVWFQATNRNVSFAFPLWHPHTKST